MSNVIKNAVAWARGIAADATHGYDQTNRWGPDYDCSSFVISAYKAAGVPLTCTYTGNMRGDMLRCGFAAVSSAAIDLATGTGLEAGDVLLNYAHHTALYIGGGRIVQASINERGGVTGGAPGDQSGREIYERSYYNYPWDCVLRYIAGNDIITTPTPVVVAVSVDVPELHEGDKCAAVAAMQGALAYAYFDPRWIDGDFGPRTAQALREYQADRGLEVDGICGAATWAALLRR